MKTILKFISFTVKFPVFVVFSLLFFSCEKNEEETGKDYILIYNGTVADADGVTKIAEMAEENGYTVEYISNIGQLPEMLDNAVAFVIGGTQDDTGGLLEGLYAVQDDLKTYIENGGNYLGICGGAYVASKGSQWDDGYETGMGLVDIESFAYDKVYSDPQIIPITWRGTPRTIYYQYGPAFAKNTIPANSEVLAYYNNANQDVAIFKTKLGSGIIIMCGPHPEADATWLIDDPEPLNANTWTETKDIFQNIFTELVSGIKQKQ
jgi:glutamine amidotransferase-like uncharacterized protein